LGGHHRQVIGAVRLSAGPVNRPRPR
jgi:hypothetical protein